MDISSMLEVQVNEVREVDSKENVTPKDLIPSTTMEPPPISQDESNFYRIMFDNDIASVRFRRLHCTACDVHIGSAPSQACNMFEHPVLRVLLCAKCREFYGDGTFEQGDDATDMFCRWCANGGNLYCCSYCSNTFCYKCIKRNFNPVIRKKIEADERWKCFVCNPADLYTARAICWAILQHVQTVTRILQNDIKMPAAEVAEKMNLDEAQCCQRRKKRKRRRTASEDEDETYIPPINNGIPIITKQKMTQKAQFKKRLKQSYYRSYNTVLMPGTPLTSQPQNNRDSNKLWMKPSNNMDSSTSINNSSSLEPKTNSTTRVSYSTNLISPVPTANLLQNPPPKKNSNSTVQTIVPSRSVTFSPSPYNLMQQGSQSTPMVTIPNPQGNLTSQPRSIMLAKKKSSTTVVTPNIINLDSDSDEPVVTDSVNPSVSVNKDNDIDVVNIRTPSSAPMPIALVSTEVPSQVRGKQQSILRESHSKRPRRLKSFTESVLLPQSYEIESIIMIFRARLSRLAAQVKKDSHISENNLTKVKQFYQEIRNTMIRLASANDRIVREYSFWNKLHNNDVRKKSSGKSSEENSSKRNDIEIPLDMACVNDSSAEDDNPDEVNNVLSPSELIFSTNPLENFSSFNTKHRFDCGTGEHSVVCKDKSIQVYDVVFRDYEKCIGHSVLKQDDHLHDARTETSVSESATIPNEHFDKYQEQFIFYLQHIEDHGIETEDTKGTSDPNESSATSDLTEDNPANVSKDNLENNSEDNIKNTENPSKNNLNTENNLQNDLQHNADPVLESLILNNHTPSSNHSCVESNTDKEVVLNSDVVPSTAIEHLTRIVNELADDLNSKEKSNTVVSKLSESKEKPGTMVSDLSEYLEVVDPREKYSKDETVIAVKTLTELLNEQDVTNVPTVTNDKSCDEKEDDCAIIDD